jgi:hypothetical protein
MFSPTRRNRNIGTPKQGFGQDNRFQIPDTWHDDKIFYERLVNPVVIKKPIHGKQFVFYVEPTLTDYYHACTVDDIERLLSLLPAKDVLNMDLIILRQPTRKQTILDYPWGRLSLFYEAETCAGPAIVLESQAFNTSIKWSKSLSTEMKDELKRLEGDGHSITRNKRGIIIETSIDSCRNTQLYRTIPHELGHYVDFLKSGKQVYDSKPPLEKEVFANRYAEVFKKKMIEGSKIPFTRIENRTGMIADGLKPEWFMPQI